MHQVFLLVVTAVGKAEIGNADVSVLVEQQVLELEITVDNVFLVEVVDTRNQLSE